MSTDLRKKVICAVVVFVNVINILNDSIFQTKKRFFLAVFVLKLL